MTNNTDRHYRLFRFFVAQSVRRFRSAHRHFWRREVNESAREIIAQAHARYEA